MRWKKWGSPMFDTSRYISILCISWSNLACWAPTLFYDVLMLESNRGLTFCGLLLVKGPSDQVQAPASGEPNQTDLTILQNLAESCTASDRFWQILTAPSVCARLLWLQTMTPQTIRPGLDMQTVRWLILLLWISVFSLFQELKKCGGISRGRPQPACL